MSKLSFALACTTVLGGTLLCGSAQAASSFVSTSTGDFVRVDTETGAFSIIGNTGHAFFDVAVLDDYTGYGVSEAGNLFSIDLATASTSLVGDLGRFVNSLGFDDSGNLFGAGGDSFFKVNIASATTSLISVIDNFESSGDLAYDGSKFFLTSHGINDDDLFSINADGTAVNRIGDIGFTGVYGLTFQDNSLLGFTDDNKVLEIDQNTGGATELVSLSGVAGDVFGAAPASTSAAVPESGMAFGLMGLGVAGLRKRKQVASAQA